MRRGTKLLSVCLCLWAMGISPVHAVSLAEIRDRGREIGAEAESLRRAGKLGYEQEGRLLERLGPLVLAFVEQSDRLTRSGGDPRRSSALKGAFEATHPPLDTIYSTRNGRLQSMARAVMDEDGDLEALYETEDWQESQAIAARALYYLNWLNFYGARLFEGARRQELLEAAERGFSEFAVGEQQNALLNESLLGRGLCHLELGNEKWAERDLKIVIAEKSVSPERKAKARLALLDVYLRAGRTDEVLRYSGELLQRKDLSGGDRNVVRYSRLTALFDVIDEKEKSQSAERYRSEAGQLIETLRKVGKGWSERVDALLIARADDPAAWVGKVTGITARWNLARLLLQREDFEHVRPLLEEIAADADPAAETIRPQASYWLGVLLLKDGDRLGAADRFDAALTLPAESFAADAAHLRFKALEGLMEGEAAAQVVDRYGAALRFFLQKHPDHAHANEGYYRLGELQQNLGEFDAAIDSYAKVEGDATLQLRAAFATVQCRFEQLKAAPDPPARERLVAVVGEDLGRFWGLVDAHPSQAESAAPASLVAKATLLQAVYVTLRGPGGAEEAARLLDDFATRFPNQPELLAQAVRLRLAALRDAGRFEDAEIEAKEHAAVLREEGHADAIDKLAASFTKEGARRAAEDDDHAARAARQTALQLYAVLTEIDESSEAGRRLKMARLSESTGELERAAQIYGEVLADDPDSLVALAGQARIAEEQGDAASAVRHWSRYAKTARPGDAAWYRGQYHLARLQLVAGEDAEGCRILEEVRSAIAGLRDKELREQLVEIYESCK